MCNYCVIAESDRYFQTGIVNINITHCFLKNLIDNIIHFSVALIENSINITFQLMKWANFVTKTWSHSEIFSWLYNAKFFRNGKVTKTVRMFQRTPLLAKIIKTSMKILDYTCYFHDLMWKTLHLKVIEK